MRDHAVIGADRDLSDVYETAVAKGAPTLATANWIVERSTRAVDLHELYDDDKPRATTYVQMAELMLQSVRQARDVVGVFYGHPGFFGGPPPSGPNA